MNQKYLIGGLIVLLGLASLGYWIYRDGATLGNGQNDTSTTTPPVVATTTPTVRMPKFPDLNRPLTVTANLTESQLAQIKNKIADINTRLKANSDDFMSWIELGLYRNSVGDYEGARIVWEYASAIRPKNSLSFGNLGFLYGYHLNDPVRAEKNYLQAIQNDPKMAYLYVQLAEFYRDVAKNMAKARAIIERGVRNNPDNAELKVILQNI